MDNRQDSDYQKSSTNEANSKQASEHFRWEIIEAGPDFYGLQGILIKIKPKNKETEKKLIENFSKWNLNNSSFKVDALDLSISVNKTNGEIQLKIESVYGRVIILDELKKLAIRNPVTSLSQTLLGPCSYAIQENIRQEITQYLLDLDKHLAQSQPVLKEWHQVRQQLKDIINRNPALILNDVDHAKVRDLIAKTQQLMISEKKLYSFFSPRAALTMRNREPMELERFVDELAPFYFAIDAQENLNRFNETINNLKIHNLSNYERSLLEMKTLSDGKSVVESLSHAYHFQLILKIINKYLLTSPQVADEILADFLSKASNKSQLNEQYIRQVSERLDQLHIANAVAKPALEAIIQEEIFDKSCQARLTAKMDFGYSQAQEQQVMWGYFCVVAEHKIGSMLQSGKNLKEIFHEMCQLRNAIAVKVVRSGESAVDFGEIRKNIAHDFYSDKEYSVANQHLFSYIQERFNLSLASGGMILRTDSNVSLPMKAPRGVDDRVKAEYANNQPQESLCDLPKESIYVAQNDHTLWAIFEHAFSKDQVDTQLEKLHEKLVIPLQELSKNIPFNSEAFLAKLGELTFYLTRLYALTRGSGAICQWIVRGIAKELIGVKIGDILLGEKRNIPCDIYAQFVHDPKDYAKAFSASLSETFSDQLTSKMTPLSATTPDPIYPSPSITTFSHFNATTPNNISANQTPQNPNPPAESPSTSPVPRNMKKT